MNRREILIEGCTVEEILALSDEEVRGLIATDEPVIFRIGTAQILGQFRLEPRLEPQRLVVELAEIHGGGEGVLILISTLCDRYARDRGIREIEWIVHAVTCVNPNLKLRRVLERRGFEVKHLPGVGEAYHDIREVPPPS